MPDRAVGEARTRDPQLGKLMLYQLSYYRIASANVYKSFFFLVTLARKFYKKRIKYGKTSLDKGRREDR